MFLLYIQLEFLLMFLRLLSQLSMLSVTILLLLRLDSADAASIIVTQGSLLSAGVLCVNPLSLGCSLNWQHQLCKNPRPNPDIKTLFIDHTCGPPNGARAPPPTNNPLVGGLPKGGAFPPLGAHSVCPCHQCSFLSYII